MLRQTYTQWALQMHIRYPSLGVFCNTLPELSLLQRKAVLTACRVQSFPEKDSRLHDRLKSVWESLVPIDPTFCELEDRLRSTRYRTLRSICEDIAEFFYSPITAGFLSAIVRSAPTNHPSFQDAKIEGLTKEIMAAVNIYHPEQLNYAVIFSSNRQDRCASLARNLEPNYPLASKLYLTFSMVKNSLQNTVLFPKTSHKTVGARVTEEFWRVVPDSHRHRFFERSEENEGVTTAMLEELYYRTGIEVQGPVEVRTAWKYNDLKPRVYYAQGGDTFRTSKFVQEIFNVIADSLEITHRQNRYFEPEGAVTKADSVVIYDYSSFTSNCQEVVSFLEQLSIFMRGVTVFILDGQEGLVARDLGQLIFEYNQECNYYAEFDVGREAELFDGEPSILGHSCGMLGIPGNITAATILHGIHTAWICGALDKSRCIGDDAKLIKELQSRLDELILYNQIQNLGPVAFEKMEFFPYDEGDDYDLKAWHYAKRPIMRSYNRIITFWLTIFPTLDCLLGLKDDNRTTLKHALDRPNRITRFSAIWHRLLKRLSIEGGFTDEVRQFLWYYQTMAFNLLGIKSYRCGRHIEDGSSFLVPLFVARDEFGIDPLELVHRDYLYEEEIEVPMVGTARNKCVGYVDEEFESVSTPVYRYLETIGILRKEMMFERISRRLLGDRGFSERLLCRSRFMYRYIVVESPPIWMYTLIADYNEL